MKSPKAIPLACAAFVALIGCGRAQTVTKAELGELLKQGRGSDNAVLYYKGSSDRYDHFVIVSGKRERSCRVAYGDVQLARRFRPTEDSSRWVVTTIR